MARREGLSTSSRCSVKDVGATINRDSDLDDVAGDAKDDIAKVDIMLD